MSGERDRRAVILLGMHRSGTSLVARALLALGVDLGDHLMPADAHNPTGYWEDLEITALNDRILAALGLAWDSVSAASLEDLPADEVARFRREAVEIVHSRFRSSMFGFKDPRTARILPFWQSVFEHLGIPATYVVVVRHPISVAASLSVRGLSPRQSCLLWLQHVLPAVAATHGRPRVVVDYDRVVDDPVGQLRRMAQALAIPDGPDTERAIAEYARAFVDVKLRHSVAGLEDVAREPSVCALAHRAYLELVPLAADARPGWDPKLVDRWARLAEPLHPAPPLGEWLDALCLELSHLRIRHSRLEREHTGQQQHLQALGSALRTREAELLAGDARAGHLTAERDAARDQLARVYRSASWRITAPLRRALRILRLLGRPFLDGAEADRARATPGTPPARPPADGGRSSARPDSRSASSGRTGS